MILGICTPLVARIVTNAPQDAESIQAMESTAEGAEPGSYQPRGLIIRALHWRSSLAGKLRLGVFIGIRLPLACPDADGRPIFSTQAQKAHCKFSKSCIKLQ